MLNRQSAHIYKNTLTTNTHQHTVCRLYHFHFLSFFPPSFSSLPDCRLTSLTFLSSLPLLLLHLFHMLQLHLKLYSRLGSERGSQTEKVREGVSLNLSVLYNLNPLSLSLSPTRNRGLNRLDWGFVCVCLTETFTCVWLKAKWNIWVVCEQAIAPYQVCVFQRYKCVCACVCVRVCVCVCMFVCMYISQVDESLPWCAHTHIFISSFYKASFKINIHVYLKKTWKVNSSSLNHMSTEFGVQTHIGTECTNTHKHTHSLSSHAEIYTNYSWNMTLCLAFSPSSLSSYCCEHTQCP